jgi:hypothetical protein
MDEQPKIKRKRLKRIHRERALTEEEWEALPGRPHLWLSGKLVEMTWEQQAGGRR